MTFFNFDGSGYGAPTSTKFTRLYNNQFFDYLSEQLPKDHKEMMKWCEVVYHNSPALVNGIKKLISYPITKLQFESQSPVVAEATKELLLSQLNIETHLQQTGLDYYVYGNAFRGIYFPFTRFLTCKYCGKAININQAKFQMRKGQFILQCSDGCGGKGIAKIDDRYTFDPSGIKLISWDPKQVDLLSNPVTGATNYYYSLPAMLKKGLVRGEHIMATTLPKVFLDAFTQQKQVMFNDTFYHMKTPSVAGYSSGWGVPPLAPALKLYLYNSILRKSVEAIGLEHITPQRILFPQGVSNDPTAISSMARWKEQVTIALERWRMDPNYVMLAPFPTGVVNIGGQGRTFMPTEEIKQTDQDMLLAMDIPIEFVYGGLKLDTGSVSLRILENQLKPYVAQLTHYVNWIVDTINAKYHKNYCHVKFGDFTLADDLMKRQLLISMAGQGASMHTVQKALGLDPEEERNRLITDRLNAYKDEKKVETAMHIVDANIASRAVEKEHADEIGTLPSYDQQKLIAAAQMQAQQMLSIPYEERRSALAQLSNEDQVMYALVRLEMDRMHESSEATTQGM